MHPKGHLNVRVIAAGVAVTVCGVAPRAGAAEATRVFARTGVSTPVSGSVPSSLTFMSFGAPTINELGEVTFQGRLQSTSTNNTGLYHGVGVAPGDLRQILRAGQAAPGMPEGHTIAQIPTYTSVGTIPYGTQVTDSGFTIAVAMVSTTPTVGLQKVPFIGFPGGDELTPMLVPGEPTPTGGTWGFDTTIGAYGEYQVIHDRSKNTLWRGRIHQFGASLAPIIDQDPSGQQNLPIDSFRLSRDGGVSFSKMESAPGPVGSTKFAAFHAVGGAITRLLSTGDSPPGLAEGVTVSTTYTPRVNNAGNYVAGAALSNPAARGAWAGSLEGGELKLVAVPGQAAPNLPGRSFLNVFQTVITPSDRIFVGVDVDVPGSFSRERAFYYSTADDPGTLHYIGREKGALPRMPNGFQWDGNAREFSVNAADQMLIWGYDALMGYDPSMGLVPLVRAGEMLEVAPGVKKAVSRFILSQDDYLVHTGSWNDGMPRSLNDRGEVAFHAQFSDGTITVMSTRIPVAGDATSDGIVDTVDFQRLFENFGKSFTGGDRSKGDFDMDGVVGFVDFQILERNFGRAPLGVASGVVAADRARVAEFGASVPEPGGAMVLALAAVCGLSRGRRCGRSATRPVAGAAIINGEFDLDLEFHTLSELPFVALSDRFYDAVDEGRDLLRGAAYEALGVHDVA
jgi:hypothetical protein